MGGGQGKGCEEDEEGVKRGGEKPNSVSLATASELIFCFNIADTEQITEQQ